MLKKVRNKKEEENSFKSNIKWLSKKFERMFRCWNRLEKSLLSHHTELSCGFDVNSLFFLYAHQFEFWYFLPFLHTLLLSIQWIYVWCVAEKNSLSFKVKFCDRKTQHKGRYEWRDKRTGSYSHLIKNTTHVLTFGFGITCVIIFTSISLHSFVVEKFFFCLSF